MKETKKETMYDEDRPVFYKQWETNSKKSLHVPGTCIYKRKGEKLK